MSTIAFPETETLPEVVYLHFNDRDQLEANGVVMGHTRPRENPERPGEMIEAEPLILVSHQLVEEAAKGPVLAHGAAWSTITSNPNRTRCYLVVEDLVGHRWVWELHTALWDECCTDASDPAVFVGRWAD